ncbi:MAG: cysteine desulfurase [Proteobacteria bacterium]|nr:cysteine desulfurase [Pseudomonadota bacterium]
MIYADNAATTAINPKALEAMLPFMTQCFGNASSTHEMGQRASQAMTKARMAIARCLGASPHEISFTSGGTESDNQAILSAAALGRNTCKTHIITSAFEHHAVLNTMKKLETDGFEITYLDIHSDGVIRPEQIAEHITPSTCLVSVMAANNETGTIQPVAEIGGICRRHHVIFHTDAVQAVGHIPVDVHEQQIDMLSMSAHKFGGPKGIGVLYARKDIPLINLLEGGSQERGKRPGTENIPAIVGMAAALEDACERMDESQKYLIPLRNRLTDELLKLPGAILNGDYDKRLPGHINFCFQGGNSESMLLLLNQQGICASAGSACTAGSMEPDHVLLALGRSPELAGTSLRLTLSESITPNDIDVIVQAVTDTLRIIQNDCFANQ